jgi:HEAT repeat protein
VNPAIRFSAVALAVTLAGAAPAPSQAPAPRSTPPAPARVKENPYAFADWRKDWPVPLEYPQPSSMQVYERSRRQALEHVVANLQGNGRREIWQMATEFFWRAPEDAVDPLIAQMDRAFSQPSLGDLVDNTVEAMGKMAREDFDDPLRRALEHPNESVRQAAFGALARSGTVATLRWSFTVLPQMDVRGRQAWLHSARVRLGTDAVPYFVQLMTPETPPPIRDLVLKEALEMPPPDAAKVLAKLSTEATGEFKAIISGVQHAAGVASGTLWLRSALADKRHEVVVHALKQLGRGDLGSLRDQVLELSSHPRPEVRLALANLLRTVEGKDVESVYEVLARPDELLETKCIALKELNRRGRTDAATALIEDVAVDIGTRLKVQLSLLIASGDDRAVKVFADRFAHSQPGEGRDFVQALAMCNAPGSAAALFELFTGPEKVIDSNGLTTLTYVTVLLPNLRGHEAALVACWDKIDPADLRRRALWLSALAMIAADRTDPAVQQPITALLRAIVFDRTQPSQLRVQALNELTMKFLSIDDVMQLKRLQALDKAGAQESAGMRAFVRDFLAEFF